MGSVYDVVGIYSEARQILICRAISSMHLFNAT
jgi:hypothetical protein